MTTAVDTSDVVETDVHEICERIGEPLREMEGKTVLVAGGAGFLPSYILDVLAFANRSVLRHPCRVIAMDNFITGVPERLRRMGETAGFLVRQQDISVPFTVDGPVDYIVHAASIASPPVYRQYPLETIRVNVRGTENLLELACQKSIRSMLYLSSSEIYGDPTPEAVPTPESYRGIVSCVGPRACYDESKRLAETLCVTYFRQHHVPVKLVRPFNVYGPRLRLDDGRIIPDLIRNALEGRPLTLFSDGRATRSFCYVSDAITAMMLILLSREEGEPFNVGNDEEVTIREVAERVCEIFDGKMAVEFKVSSDAQYLTDNPQRRCPDLKKVKKAIPWSPQISLLQGLRKSVAYYKAEGSKPR